MCHMWIVAAADAALHRYPATPHPRLNAAAGFISASFGSEALRPACRKERWVNFFSSSQLYPHSVKPANQTLVRGRAAVVSAPLVSLALMHREY